MSHMECLYGIFYGICDSFLSQVNCDLTFALWTEKHHSSCCKNSWVLKYSGIGSSNLAIIL